MKLTLVLLLVGFSASPGFADENLPKTLLAERGELLVSEDFSKPVATIEAGRSYTAKKGWRVFSGEWQSTGGVLRGRQLPDEGRSAFVVYAMPFKDAVIQFDVRLDGCRQVIFRIQDAVPEHICSVRINYDGFSAQKDDHDHARPDQAQPFGKVALPIARGEWKTVVVEIQNGKMTATIDGHSVAGTHPLLAADKATFEFVVTGEAADFRNVRVWEAHAAPVSTPKARAPK